MTGRGVLRGLAEIKLRDVSDPVETMHLGIAAEKAGDFRIAARFLVQAAARLRDQGRLGLLAQTLVHYAWSATFVSMWDSASAAADEAVALARDTSQPQFG